MMRKFFAAGLMSALALFLAAPAAAQDGGLGVRGGLSFYKSTLEFMGVEESSDSKLGFTAGIYMTRNLSDLISVEPELRFVQKGASESDPDFGDDDLTLNYLDVPVHFKVNFPLDGGTRPFLAVSPYAGYLLSASATDDEEDPKDYLKSLNYGVVLGGGVGLGRLNVQLGYDLGLANLWDGDDLFEDEEFDDEFGDFFGDLSGFNFKSSGLVLTVGVNF